MDENLIERNRVILEPFSQVSNELNGAISGLRRRVTTAQGAPMHYKIEIVVAGGCSRARG